MTTIGVVSDTHVNLGGKRQLPPQLFALLRDVDLILHAGDLNTLRVVTDLEALAPVYAVRGNNDDWEAMRLPSTRVLPIEACRIGLAHGDLGHGGATMRPLPGVYGSGHAGANALSLFEEQDIHCIVFGHSHWPLIQWWQREDQSQVLLFNPGSAGKKRKAPHHSCGLLRVDGAHLEAELLTWD